jgi:hypothetical protein
MKNPEASRAATVKALGKNRGELEATTLRRMLALAGAPIHDPTRPALADAGRLTLPLGQRPGRPS